MHKVKLKNFFTIIAKREINELKGENDRKEIEIIKK